MIRGYSVVYSYVYVVMRQKSRIFVAFYCLTLDFIV